MTDVNVVSPPSLLIGNKVTFPCQGFYNQSLSRTGSSEGISHCDRYPRTTTTPHGGFITGHRVYQVSCGFPTLFSISPSLSLPRCFYSALSFLLLFLSVSCPVSLKFLRTLVLDEADKLVDESFYPQVKSLASQLPKSKQILAMSATYHKVRFDD